MWWAAPGRDVYTLILQEPSIVNKHAEVQGNMVNIVKPIIATS